MSTRDAILALEQVNKEYLTLINSKEYRRGKRITKISKAFQQHDFRALFGFVKSLIIQHKMMKISKQNKRVDVFPQYQIEKAKKFYRGAIYTCITGGYDVPSEPIYIGPGEKFFLYTDEEKHEDESTWNIVSTKKISGVNQESNINRYCKMHPKELFPDFDYSIYIDGNVQVVSDISMLYEIAKKSKTGIAMHRHHARECTYKEAKACITARRGNAEAIKRQMYRYKENGFPENFGFCEATIIVVDLHNDLAKSILCDWWEEYTESKSRRDQLALPFVIWKHGLKMVDIGDLGNNLLMNPKFRIVNLGAHSFR